MRLENLVFGDEHVKIEYLNVESEPLGWKNAITVIWMLNGTLDLTVENESYTIREGEIEVINANEVYSLDGNSENRLIMLEIDPTFFEAYYEDAPDMFYYTNLPDDDIWDERYEVLRSYISILLFESVMSFEDKAEFMDATLLDMMYHLLNHFHYLYSDEESLRDDEEEKERYHRIVKYLSNNYDRKISLQDLADTEYLSAPYLSAQMKEKLGVGFNDYLNQIRSEESVKLLLDSDLNISQIAEEVGFSHVRYYNKHFEMKYGMSPSEYRSRYKMSKEEYDSMIRVSILPLKECLPFVESYLTDYPRYNYDKKIVRIKVDINDESIGETLKPRTINLGDATLLLEEKNRQMIRELKSFVNYKNGLIYNLFSNDMDIYRSRNNRFINWTRVELILEFLMELQIDPIIITNGLEKYILEDFRSYFYNEYDEDTVEYWLDDSRIPEDLKYLSDIVNPMYDRLEMVPYILYNFLERHREPLFRCIDEINRDIYLENDTFFGGDGLITNSFLKKPSYFALGLLMELGDDVVQIGEDYVITRSDEGFQILLYNTSGINPDDMTVRKENMIRRFSVNVMRMENTYQVTKFSISDKKGSIYDKWVDLGKPERMDNYFWDLLDRYEKPDIEFGFTKPGTVYHIKERVPVNSCVLYLLKRA